MNKHHFMAISKEIHIVKKNAHFLPSQKNATFFFLPEFFFFF